MAKNHANEDLRPSVLDRLVEGQGRSPGGRPQWYSARELKNAVARDLEWLLNTYCSLPEGIEHLAEARKSVLSFGIPDISVFSWTSDSDARTVCEMIEEAVRTFEPRLLPHSVRVELVPSRRADDFKLHFRIDAIVHVDPITEPVSFDTDILVDSLAFEVKQAS